MRLLPHDRVLGWTPYVWLVYTSLYAVYPFLARVAEPAAWVLHAAGLAAFLPLYFRGYWVEGRDRLVIVVAMAALGAIASAINPGALLFFVYAASFVGGAGTGRAAGVWIGGLTVAAVTTAWLTGWWHPVMLAMVAILTPMIGFVTLHDSEVRRRDASLKLAHEDIARFATLAERDRIAADLHDLLGHTLSVIVLKAELAGKLMARDPARAAEEIGAVERISREVLGEVRRAVHGFKAATLADELVRARAVLATAGIALEARAPLLPASGRIPGLDARVEHALAMVLREAVTNVIRHAGATRCIVRVARDGQTLRGEIADDGRGGVLVEGAGLQGMRARLREIGGALEHDGQQGTIIRMTAPWTPDRELAETPA